MYILYLQSISVWTGHTSSAQEPQPASRHHAGQYRARPFKLLSCLILKRTYTTGSHVPILQTTLFPLDLPTAAPPPAVTLWKDLHWDPRQRLHRRISRPLLGKCPRRVSLPTKAQAAPDSPATESHRSWQLPPCVGEVSHRSVCLCSFNYTVCRGWKSERLVAQETTSPWSPCTCPDRVSPPFPQASHRVIISLLSR